MKQEHKHALAVRTAAACLCLMGASTAMAQTGDVFDYVWPSVLAQTQCASGGTSGNTVVFWTDVDKDGTAETAVVLTVVSGHGGVAHVSGTDNRYGFGYAACGTGATTPTGPGRLSIRFVDAVDKDFNYQVPSSWKFKAIPSVNIDGAWWDGLICPRTEPTGTAVVNPYFRIQAYKEFGQVGEVLGTASGNASSGMRYQFSDPVGIKDVYVHTDFCENQLNNLTLGNALKPFIVTEPRDVTRLQATSATLAVVAQGTSPLKYQWYRNGVAVQDGRYTISERTGSGPVKGPVRMSVHVIAGATTPTLTISNLRAADGGSYYAVVSNPAGAASSATVQLRVGVPLPSRPPQFPAGFVPLK